MMVLINFDEEGKNGVLRDDFVDHRNRDLTFFYKSPVQNLRHPLREIVGEKDATKRYCRELRMKVEKFAL